MKRLLTSIGFLALVVAVAAQQPAQPEKRKLSKEQQKEVQTLIAIVDKAIPGQTPSDPSLGWGNDFLMAQQGRTYVPFTISIPPGTFSTNNVAMYLRVVNRGAAAPGALETKDAKDAKKDDKKDDKKDEKKAGGDKRDYPFEDIFFVTLPGLAGMKPGATPASGAPGAAAPPPPGPAASTGKPVDIRVSRAFAVPGGEYDVYVALKDMGEEKKGQPLPKSTVLKHALSVPNFATGELTTSSVIIADKVEPMTAAISVEQQAENPYTFGATKITPATATKFPKSAELSVIFIVYNPALDPAKKPDVTIEYNFHRKAQEGDKFFNKTPPQQFNASSLPPNFDLAAGHQLVAGQTVPLASFPEGDYRLEIKVTDNVSKKSLTKDINFTVGTGPSA